MFPSLHPGIKPHLPLEIAVTAADGRKAQAVYRLLEEDRTFKKIPLKQAAHKPDPARPAVRSGPALMTYDLRLG